MQEKELVVGNGVLTIEDVLAVADGQRQVRLSEDPAFLARIERGADLLREMWQSGRVVYGVTTGVGESCVRPIPRELVPEFSRNLARMHGCSAWAAEALKLTMPASVFSRSTESHNQDKVSMGTIAARDATRVVELAEQVLVSTLAAAGQALELRVRRKELIWSELAPGLRETFTELRSMLAFVEEDRPLEGELRRLHALVRERGFRLDGETAGKLF